MELLNTDRGQQDREAFEKNRQPMKVRDATFQAKLLRLRDLLTRDVLNELGSEQYEILNPQSADEIVGILYDEQWRINQGPFTGEVMTTSTQDQKPNLPKGWKPPFSVEVSMHDGRFYLCDADGNSLEYDSDTYGSTLVIGGNPEPMEAIAFALNKAYGDIK